MSKTEYVEAEEIVAAFVALGRNDDAFDWLEQAYQERSTSVIWLKVDPNYDAVRSDPRFTALLEKIGLE